MIAGRIRTIKPSIRTDARMQALSDAARLIVINVITLADDEGRLEADPDVLRAAIWAKQPCSRKKFEKAWAEVLESGILVEYWVDNQVYAYFRNWKKHQRIDRPSPSRLPAPPEAAIDDPIRTVSDVGRSSIDQQPIGRHQNIDRTLQTEVTDWPKTSGFVKPIRRMLDEDSDMEMERDIERVFSRACAEDLDFGSLIEEAELEGHIPPATDRSSGIMRAAPRTPPDEPSPPESPQGPDPEAIAPSWPDSVPAIGEVEDVVEVVDIEEVVGEPVDLPLSRTPQPVGTVRQDLVVDGRHVTVYAAAPAPAPTVWGTPPPDDLPISTEFADGCVMAGLPRPTSLHVAAMLDWHRANGKTSADWYASLRTWMRREGTFGSRWGGPMKARAQVFEVAPPPEPLTPEELANAKKPRSQMTKKERWEYDLKQAHEQLYGKSA